MFLFQGFDSKFLLTAISKLSGVDKSKIQITAVNSQKVTSIRLHCYLFKDSAKFVNSSLQKLAEIHFQSYADFAMLRNHPVCNNIDGSFSPEKFNLLATGKQYFPYDFVTSKESLLHIGLPTREDFFNKLTGSTLSQEEYEHANIVYKTFECTNLQDYMLLYLCTDVLLLASIFDSFCNMAYNKLNIWPSHFLSTPG